MKMIKLELTLEEANLVIKALSQLPFMEVYQLIGKVHASASQQLQGQARLDMDSNTPSPEAPKQ